MKINPAPPTDWKDLQKQTALILSECGLMTEVEKTIQLVRGTVNVDVHAEDSVQTPNSVYLCECKHWSNPVSKDVVHGFRTVMQDFGANLGYIVSKAGFQSGAIDAAKSINVRLFTWDEFEAEWMQRWIDTYLRPRLFVADELLHLYMDPLIGKTIGSKLDVLTREKQQAFFDLRYKPEIALPSTIGFHYGTGPWGTIGGKQKLVLPFSFNRPEDNQHASPKLLQTESLREFGGMVLEWANESKRKLEATLTP